MAALMLLASSACTMPIPDARVLTSTRAIALQSEILVAGPLFPERLDSPVVLPESPITELMPGDRVRAEVVIVDTAAEPLAASEVESLWFQCGVGCYNAGARLDRSLADVDCDAVEDYDLGSRCVLGRGDLGFEFTLPPLTQRAALMGTIQLFAVFAWDGRRAEDCWETRKSLEGSLDGCAFVAHTLELGPEWLLQAHADAEGFVTSVPLEHVPFAAFLQPANHPPFLTGVRLGFDGSPIGLVAGAEAPELALPFPVRRGQTLDIVPVLDEDAQLLQTIISTADPEGLVFAPRPEAVSFHHYTTAGLRTPAATSDSIDAQPPLLGGPQEVELVVEQSAEVGEVLRVVLVASDGRGGDVVRWLAFEVVE